jgi:hypothetical protein
MDGQQVCEVLGITPHQRRRLLHRGHLQRRRLDRNGNPCRHDETGEPCSCAWDYDAEAVQSLGRVGTADRVSAGARARPLPKRFRYDSGTAAEDIARDLAARERARRRAHAVSADVGNEWSDEHQAASLGWLLTLGGVVLLGLGLAWHWTRRSGDGGLVGPP